ncbi:MAG: single-stranded-DNA-specific exonuclease RecJ [Legionellaceae bacterium]|nr:single-stranded-DNA-specific exonuclease RecJ [Legionellaceae bacterium]
MNTKPRAIPSDLMPLDGIPDFLQPIFHARGIRTPAQLDKRLQALLAPEQLIDLDKAVYRLALALQQQQRILIIGDFDADGATSTALAVSALQAMGAKNVDYLVPNRFEFGYGLSPEIVELAARSCPHLLVTVDNGISSIEGVACANAKGMDVVITDHHLAGERLPEAYAIVNPNQPGCPFPSKAIAGVGVIFYVMIALRRYLAEQNWFAEPQRVEPNMAQFLDLVALGTVADVVSLDQNNRILVSQGIARIRQGKVRPGIKALLSIAGRDLSRLRETDLGFAIAPRLNAAGRLQDMSQGIACLLAENIEEANERAAQLDQLNQERRHIESEMKAQAFERIEAIQKKLPQGGKLPLGICLFEESWHQGVIGILAGRLKEKLHRPTIIFAQVSELEMKGSARSVHGLNIRDLLATMNKDHPGLIKKFGGHAMAAGLSIEPRLFAEFKTAFEQAVAREIDHAHCEGEILTDGALPDSALTLETARLIQEYGPWGQHFPEPCFEGCFEIIEQRIVGQNHLKLSLAHSQQAKPLDAIAFNVDLQAWPNHRASHVRLAYKLDINVYQGRAKLQLMVEGLEAQHQEPPVLQINDTLSEYSW